MQEKDLTPGIFWRMEIFVMVAVTAKTSSVAENMKKIMEWREANLLPYSGIQGGGPSGGIFFVDCKY